jgi:fimbrial chaperone protein
MRLKLIAALMGATALFSSTLPPVTAPAWAIDVTPMVMHITPSGSGAGYRLSIRNTEDQPVTVELQAFRMTVDENGVRALSDEVDDLAIFPPQSVIPPNREQVVQVRYVGSPDAGPQMYLVRVGQLPVTFSSDAASATGAAVQVAFNVNTHVLMAPAGARPELRVVSAQKADNGDILIVAENQGAGFASLREARYTLRSGGGTVDVRPQDVVLGQVSTLPGGARRNIRIPAALAPGVSADVTASIELS